MANPEHVEIVKQGAEAIRKWREKNPNVRIDLSRAGIWGADFRGTDLREADLSWADLSGADLREADLTGANLRNADLSGVNLGEHDPINVGAHILRTECNSRLSAKPWTAHDSGIRDFEFDGFYSECVLAVSGQLLVSALPPACRCRLTSQPQPDAFAPQVFHQRD